MENNIEKIIESTPLPEITSFFDLVKLCAEKANIEVEVIFKKHSNYIVFVDVTFILICTGQPENIELFKNLLK